VQAEVNAALTELGARFAVEITPEFEIEHFDCATAVAPRRLAASLASGYQRFALSLAARLAVWRLASAPRVDALFIDEGFGACDDEYLAGLAAALEAIASAGAGGAGAAAIAGTPRLVFVVSHVDALKERVEHALEIRRTPTGSQVSNLAPRPAPIAQAAPAPAAQAARPAPAQPAPTLVPDTADPAKLYCTACRRALPYAWADRHLASGLHAAAVRRAAA